MRSNVYVYPAIFSKEDGEIGYAVYFPDFENCFTCGEGLTHSIAMARERLGIEIEEYQEQNKTLPAPSDIALLHNSINRFSTLIDVDMLKYYAQTNNEELAIAK